MGLRSGRIALGGLASTITREKNRARTMAGSRLLPLRGDHYNRTLGSGDDGCGDDDDQSLN